MPARIISVYINAHRHSHTHFYITCLHTHSLTQSHYICLTCARDQANFVFKRQWHTQPQGEKAPQRNISFLCFNVLVYWILHVKTTVCAIARDTIISNHQLCICTSESQGCAFFCEESASEKERHIIITYAIPIERKKHVSKFSNVSNTQTLCVNAIPDTVHTDAPELKVYLSVWYGFVDRSRSNQAFLQSKLPTITLSPAR